MKEEIWLGDMFMFKSLLISSTFLTSPQLSGRPEFEIIHVFPERANVTYLDPRGNQAVGVEYDANYVDMPFRWSHTAGVKYLPKLPNVKHHPVLMTEGGAIYGNYGARDASLWSSDGILRWQDEGSSPQPLNFRTSGQHGAWGGSSNGRILGLWSGQPYLSVSKGLYDTQNGSFVRTPYDITPQLISPNGRYAIGSIDIPIPFTPYLWDSHPAVFTPGQQKAFPLNGTPRQFSEQAWAVNNKGMTVGQLIGSPSSDGIHDEAARWDPKGKLKILERSPDLQSALALCAANDATAGGHLYTIGSTEAIYRAVTWDPTGKVQDLRPRIAFKTRQQKENWFPTSVSAMSADGKTLSVSVRDTRGTVVPYDDKWFSMIVKRYDFVKGPPQPMPISPQ